MIGFDLLYCVVVYCTTIAYNTVVVVGVLLLLEASRLNGMASIFSTKGMLYLIIKSKKAV